MMTYYGVVHKDPDSAYGVYFPDIEGCFSASDEIDDVLKNGIEAISLHLEEIGELPAKSLNEILKDQDIQKDLSEGGFLMAFPYVKFTGRTKKANITLDAGLLLAIDKTAKERGLTRSAFLADLARNEILG